MVNVWDNFGQGLRIGDNMGDQVRDARAYRDGGLDGVAEAAGRTGSLETMEGARGMQRRQRVFEDDQRNQAYQRMETIAPWARNAIRATRTMDPARARAFLTQNQQRFLDFGFTPEQVQAGIAGLTSDNAEERAQWQQQLDAAFTQHQDPNWQLVQTPQGQQAAAIDPEGQIQLGGVIPGGGAGRYATDEELAAQGYAPGSVVWIAPGQPPRVLQRPTRGRSGQGAEYYEDDGYDYEGN